MFHYTYLKVSKIIIKNYNVLTHEIHIVRRYLHENIFAFAFVFLFLFHVRPTRAFHIESAISIHDKEQSQINRVTEMAKSNK